MATPPPDDADPIEHRLRHGLPRPPRLQDLATTGVWIVQWRQEHGPRPGIALHRWLEERHPGWSRLVDCQGRTDVVSAIKAATWSARDGRASPILHLDADCDGDGLTGPERGGGPGRAAWGDLAPYLAQLNVATRGNLVLVCTAGAGVAGRLAGATRERSPCAAVVAPSTASPPPPAPWLIATQRLYRSWRQGQPGLADASVPLAPAMLEAASMPDLLYERLLAHLFAATRADAVAAPGGGPGALLARLGLEADPSLAWPALPRRLQRYWRTLFMADLHPENLQRFDFELKTAAWRVLQARGLA
ncbi:hypothetical protein L599_002800000040 [Luteimonas sp. J16]|uniref:hypothetical protein n=1 Tax=unclassified Luteimonas TaxID=2629088 RepID=UPI00047A18AB|nr:MULTISPECIES: hypothetical protein [unclassified Luteimonas]TWG90955.1 hypothetical protein L599_002800000040 [Luteimonas sp. J16]